MTEYHHFNKPSNWWVILTQKSKWVENEYSPGGGGGGGTQMLFGRGCAAEASKPVPIFKGHFGRKGTHY